MGQCNYHLGRLMLSGVRQIELNMADWFLSNSLVCDLDDRNED